MPVLVPDAEPARARAKLRRERFRQAALTDDRVRAVYRFAVRHGAYVFGGGRVVAHRTWDSHTAARHERMIRAAEAAGLWEEVKDWEAREYQFRKARHKRRMDLLTLVLSLPRAVASALGASFGVLLAVGVLLAYVRHDVGQLLAPLNAAIQLVAWVAFIAGVVWGPLLFCLPFIALAAVWSVGCQRHTAPRWALPASQRDDVLITPSIVVTAFRDLGISKLRKSIEEMGDVGAAMLSPIANAGCGVEVDVTLPSGVSTDEIQKRRRKLAENLGRHEHELFITIPPQPRTVRLWIADSGALDEPIGLSPLVTDPDVRADYTSGRAPWGVNLRGDPATISLYPRHFLITGLSNQGKTAAIRALALWLAVDPRVKFYIGDLKGIGDWGMFQGIAEVLIQGPTDDHVAAVTEMLEWGVDEMNRRLQAAPGTKFGPVILIVDEAQVAFMCPAKDGAGLPYGGKKAISRYFNAARKIHNQGRAVDVILWQGTQNPTDENLPSLVREGAHTRAALVLGTESQAKMALGEDPVNAGAAPHKLRQGLDKGTLVVTGDGVEIPPGEPAITIRTHFVDTDPAKEVADRAKQHRAQVVSLGRLQLVEDRDPLADLATVVGSEDRVRTPEVIHRLKNLAEDFYRDWDGGRLRRLLTEAGEDTGVYQGYPVVRRERVLRALASRDRAADDPGEGQVTR